MYSWLLNLDHKHIRGQKTVIWGRFMTALYLIRVWRWLCMCGWSDLSLLSVATWGSAVPTSRGSRFWSSRSAEEELCVEKLVLCVGLANRVWIGEGVQVGKQVEPSWEVFGLPCSRVCGMNRPKINVFQALCRTILIARWQYSLIADIHYEWKPAAWSFKNTHEYGTALKRELSSFKCFCHVLLIWPTSTFHCWLWRVLIGSRCVLRFLADRLRNDPSPIWNGEMPIERFIIWGMRSMPVCDSTNPHTLAHCWCGWMLCNLRTNRATDETFIIARNISSDRIIRYIIHKTKG